MERDFMGLNAKDSVVAVKEEVIEDSKDSGFGRSSGIPWPMPSKNIVGAGVKQQKSGGNLLATPNLILPSLTPVVGSTEQWINSNASEVPTQLTIFYDGTVNVFDDISTEKAQAIMLLAGKGCILSNMAQAKFDAQAPLSVSGTGRPIHTFADRALANESMSTPKCSGMPKPLSVTSHPADQSSVTASNNDDIKVPNTIAMSATLANKGGPPIMVTSSGPMISSAVPQARKASLARFLEKRKERAMKAAPYNLGKNVADSATPDSACVGFSATSGVGSCSVSSGKEINGNA